MNGVKGLKLIEINMNVAKDLVRMLDKMHESICIGCADTHEDGCPAKKAEQLRNYLTTRINNPNQRFGI